MRIAYRLRQFLRTAGVPHTPPDLGSFANLLTPEQYALFTAMAVADQWHCLAVARALAAQGEENADLLRAALIHDVGKSLAHIGLWERVVHVLIARLTPHLVGRLGSARPDGWGHGLYVLAYHASLGAELAAQAGFSSVTVALVRGDGEPCMQALLNRADDEH